jgi:hypothetical protein
LQNGYIQRNYSPSKQTRDIAQKNGHKIGSAILHRLPHIGTRKEAMDVKTILVLFLCVGSRAFGVQLIDLNISQLVATLSERLYQYLGRSSSCMDKNSIPGAND